MYLRRKTEAGGEPRLVHTVRGRRLRPAGTTGREAAARRASGPGSARCRCARGWRCWPRSAVALAVAACAMACWFLVRGQLIDSAGRRRCATTTRVDPGISRRPGAAPGSARRADAAARRTRSTRPSRSSTGDGNSCVIVGNKRGGHATSDIARRRARRGSSRCTTARSLDGSARTYRVLHQPRRRAPDVAVSVATAADRDRRVRCAHLALDPRPGRRHRRARRGGRRAVALARAGLRPVDRLTDAVEHIARTEDLSVRIPVEGDDEIARLSRSFNSMTAALASSRELQQQLIADAGHELRTPLTSLRTNIELLARSEETGRAAPAGRPQGAAGLGQGADDRTGRAHRRPAGAVPAGRGAGSGPASRSSRCTRSPSARAGAGPAARPRADDHGASWSPGTYAASRRRWSGRWSTSSTTR